MGELLERFSEALNGIYHLHNPVIKMDEVMVLSLCDRFLSKSEADQRRLSEIFETLSANDQHLELNSLGFAEVKERFLCLDQFNQGQRSAPYSRSHHLYLAKYTLLAKAVLLVCYHHDLSRDELAVLPVISPTVAYEMVPSSSISRTARVFIWCHSEGQQGVPDPITPSWCALYFWLIGGGISPDGAEGR